MAYKVAIVADDGFSTVLDKLNKKLIQQQKEVEKITKPMQAYAAHWVNSFKTFSKVAGTTDIAKGMQQIGQSAQKASAHLSSIIAPLSFITSIVSIAGMERLTSKWIDFSREVRSTSLNMGVTAEKLLSMRMAAEMAGVSSSTLTSALGNLQGALQDAVMGRNATVAAYLNSWGIGFKKSAYEAKNASEVMPKLFDKLKTVENSYLRLQIAQELFGSSAAEMMPYIMQGSEGWKKYNDMMEKYAKLQAGGLEAAMKMREGLTKLSVTLTTLGYQLISKLSPTLGGFIESWQAWADNLLNDSGSMDAFVKQIDDFFQTLKRGWVWLDKTVQGMGGWGKVIKGIVETLLALKGLSTLISTLETTRGLFLMISGAVTVVTGVVTGFFRAVSTVFSKIVRLGGRVILELFDGWDTVLSWRFVTPLFDALNSIGIRWALTFAAIEFTVGATVSAIVAAIGVGIYEIWKHWDEVTTWMGTTFSEVATGLKNNWGNFQIFLTQASNNIQNVWQTVCDNFINNWHNAEGVLATGLENVKSLFKPFTEAFLKIVEPIGSFFDTLYQNKIKPVFDKIMGVMKWMADHSPFKSTASHTNPDGTVDSNLATDYAPAQNYFKPYGGAGVPGHWLPKAVTSDTVDKNLSPEQRALLDSIASSESGGDYGVIYGGGSFDPDNSPDHPRQFAAGPNGPSSASGRYQITSTTYDDLHKQHPGLPKGMDKNNQDLMAIQLAEDRYRSASGKSLQWGLKNDPDGVMAALKGTWTSLPGGIEENANTGKDKSVYQERLQHYNQTAPVATTPSMTPSSATAAPANGKVQVEVTLNGAPSGTTANVKTAGVGLQASPVKIATSMPLFGIT